MIGMDEKMMGFLTCNNALTARSYRVVDVATPAHPPPSTPHPE